ncbi:MAG: tetratricopeptide repeat protein [Polyangiales bacterium]
MIAGTAWACGASPPPQTLAPLKVVARVDDAGHLRTDSYDAALLLRRGLAAYERAEFLRAAAYFAQLVREFRRSRLVVPARYNRALSLRRAGQRERAWQLWTAFIVRHPEAKQARQARFHLIDLALELDHSSVGLRHVQALRHGTALSTLERFQLRVAAAQLSYREADCRATEREARTALAWLRRQGGASSMAQAVQAARAQLHVAHCIRDAAEAVPILAQSLAEQSASLDRRARLMLRAQRGYFDTMGWQHLSSTAAAGYAIGGMYRRFWDAIVTAEVPPDPDALQGQARALHVQAYRARLKSLVLPLLKHAIRYWELTLALLARHQPAPAEAQPPRAGTSRASVRRATPLLPDAVEGQLRHDLQQIKAQVQEVEAQTKSAGP